MVQEALGKNKFFGTCAGVVGEEGEAQTVVVVNQMVESMSEFQEEIRQVKERLFGGKLDREQRFWEGFPAKREGAGAAYFIVFAYEAQNIPEDVCLGMGRVLLGMRGR